MALIVVLACLVLVSVLVVSFLHSVTTELQSSKAHSDSTNVRLLSESAVNVVMSQIKEATKDNRLAWASQPGMIRTFDNGGRAAGYYKLYSSSRMSDSTAFKIDSEEVPRSWWQDTGSFTDLNEPLLNKYPIMNPTLANGTDVPGFFITGAPVAGGPGANPAPMPVRWLYVLKNGTMVAAEGSGTRASVPGADSSPIIGRVAFWTDDETCKVNINTASEGSFWDTPKVLTKFEGEMAEKQPFQREYQRYPGHPATTSLSAVFGNTLKFESPTAPTYPELIPYYTLAPRINLGGSEGGTTRSVDGAANMTLDSDRLYATIDELQFRPELVSNSSRMDLGKAGIKIEPDYLEQVRFLITASSRAPDVNLFNRPRVGIWPIYDMTRMPDKTYRTLYDRMIAFCSTIGDPLDKYYYFFQRQNSASSTIDLPDKASNSGLARNRLLLNYLERLTSAPFPGFGGTFADKYQEDHKQILTEIFDYIRSTNLIDLSSGITPYTPKYNTSQQGRLNPDGSATGQVVPINDTVNDTRGFGRMSTVTEGAFIFYGIADPASNPDAEEFKDPANPSGPLNPDQIMIRAVFLPEMFCPSLGWVAEFPNFKIQVDGLDSLTWSKADTAGVPIDGTGTNMGFPKSARYTTTEDGLPTLTRWYGGHNGVRRIHGDKNLDQLGLDNSFPNYSATRVFPMAKNSTTRPTTTPTQFFWFSGGPVTVKIVKRDNPAEVFQSITMYFPSTTLPVPRLPPVGPDFTLRKFGTKNEVGNPDATSYGRFASHWKTNDTNVRIKVSWVTPWDTVRSVSVRDDARLIAGLGKVSDLATNESGNMFATLGNYKDITATMSHTLTDGSGIYPLYGAFAGHPTGRGRLVKNATYFRYSENPNTLNSFTTIDPNRGGLRTWTQDMDILSNGVALGRHWPAAIASNDVPGDWDNGIADIKDGPYINKPDEGSLFRDGSSPPYFSPSNFRSEGSATFFSPNRQIPSAAMFGSLPTGVKRNRPWQTLLFRPGPAGHPGLGSPASGPPFSSPPDHLLLDLFHMPVVEPYPISEPLSTAGRINMNYQIVPFAYITRDTGVRAVLKSQRILAVSLNEAENYKNVGVAYAPKFSDLRSNLNLEEKNGTLQGFQDRFGPDAKDVFRSASEICSIWLVPQGSSYADAENYWKGKSLTGDNSREKPYADIYPRLTTKSNTFTVHYRVQTLQKPQSRLNLAEFDTARGDRITGELRGSAIVERYVDPHNPELPDFASLPLSDPEGNIDLYYKFRVLSTKKFTP